MGFEITVFWATWKNLEVGYPLHNNKNRLLNLIETNIILCIVRELAEGGSVAMLLALVTGER